jgi:hypothetical protein
LYLFKALGIAYKADERMELCKNCGYDTNKNASAMLAHDVEDRSKVRALPLLFLLLS